MVFEIEECAYHAWPAAVTAQVDGWRFRFNGGVTGRANSVWPNADEGRVPLPEKIAAAEAFYRVHGIPAAFQICPSACPDNLDAVLDAHGYGPAVSRTCVQAAELAAVLAGTVGRWEAPVTIEPGISDDWHAIYAASEGAAGPGSQIRRGIIERIALPTGFALARCDGEPAAVGLGVADRDWVGLFCIATRPEFRRRGLGGAVVSALARWAAGLDAARVYLQVTEGNTAARGLYEGIGFRNAYMYHYRKREL